MAKIKLTEAAANRLERSLQFVDRVREKARHYDAVVRTVSVAGRTISLPAYTADRTYWIKRPKPVKI